MYLPVVPVSKFVEFLQSIDFLLIVSYPVITGAAMPEYLD
uniref:Uncharacterized protein n=1 Tax=Siphoviridae sp. ctqwO1 TaxID=2826472 RepID=A0A8S5QML6_9CAUD|nr:MAG TPA: hypothetical protein [Siphoviridae sp. ctqwO1]DAZ32285.1 MAG TPA: hypothetical protein [Caudoviricetes sp.]